MSSIEDLELYIKNKNKGLKKEVFRRAVDVQISERIPTSSFGLDLALGGGWPSPSFVLLYGDYSSGKTTMSLRTVAEAQKLGKSCVWIDAEKAFDKDWATLHGVDLNNLWVMKENSVESITDSLHEALDGGLVDVVVIDSISAIHSETLLDDEKEGMGLHARSLGKLYVKFNAWNKSTLILLLSQVRKDLNAYGMTIAAGGKATNHNASVIVYFSTKRDMKIFDNQVFNGKPLPVLSGQKTAWEVTKSKVSTPFVSGVFPIWQDGQSSHPFEVFEEAVKRGLIEKSSSWYELNGKKIQGEIGVLDYLKDNPKDLERLRNEILKKSE